MLRMTLLALDLKEGVRSVRGRHWLRPPNTSSVQNVDNVKRAAPGLICKHTVYRSRA